MWSHSLDFCWVCTMQWCWCGNWQLASRLVQTQLICFQCKCYWKMPPRIWTGHLVSTIEAKELSLFISTETGKPIQRRQTLSATLGQYKKEQIGIFPLYLYILDILFHYRNIEFEIFISSQCNGKCNQTCLLIAIIGSTFSTGDFCKHIHTKIFCFGAPWDSLVHIHSLLNEWNQVVLICRRLEINQPPFWSIQSPALS